MSNLEKLENAYFEGLMKGYWNTDTVGEVTYNLNSSLHEDVMDINDELERLVYGKRLTSVELYKSGAWKVAMERFKKMEQSPLMQGLK